MMQKQLGNVFFRIYKTCSNLIKDPIYKEKYCKLVFVRIVKHTSIKSSATTKNREGNKNGVTKRKLDAIKS